MISSFTNSDIQMFIQLLLFNQWSWSLNFLSKNIWTYEKHKPKVQATQPG